MKRRTVRITPLGYIVLTIIILVMVVSIYFIVWSMRNTSGEQPQGNLKNFGMLRAMAAHARIQRSLPEALL